MSSFRSVGVLAALICAMFISQTSAQSPSVLYTWDGTGNPSPNVESWVKNFGPNSVSIDNAIPGELRIIETGGLGQAVAISDGSNRVRESLTASGGGTDLTGLEYLEFDLGHSGTGNILTQFFVQAGLGFNYVTLANLNVGPGVNTYQVPITGLSPAQRVYVRTMGFNAFDHAAEGDVVWTLREVRSGGTPLVQRDLITHNVGTGDGGRQTAIGNFDLAAIQGNNGGQNQSGLSQNPAGNGSLQWVDLGGQNGAAMGWGNGTTWDPDGPGPGNGNTFNSRATDLSNYERVLFRISATDPNNGGGTLSMNSYMQTNNFQFQNVQGGLGQSIPIDGKFHNVTWNLAGLNNMSGVDLVGLNLGAHPQNLIINVDLIRFTVPEPASVSIAAIGMLACLAFTRRMRS